MQMPYQKKLAIGQTAETDIARFLQDRGYWILPMYESEYESGKGPRLFSAIGTLIAPDLFVFGKPDCENFFAECKQKGGSTWYRKSRTWQTGIDYHLYTNYKRVQKLTKIPVQLFFAHCTDQPEARDLHAGSPDKCPMGLFTCPIDKPIHHDVHQAQFGEGGWGPKGMVYWDVDQLERITNAWPIKNRS